MSGGGGFWQPLPSEGGGGGDAYAAKLYRTTDLNLVAGSAVDIAFNAEAFDPSSAASTATGLYTAPVTGVYLAVVRSAIVGAANGERFFIGIKVAGTEVLRGTDRTWTTGSGFEWSLDTMGHVSVTAGQTIGAAVTQIGGTARKLGSGGETYTFMTIARVG